MEDLILATVVGMGATGIMDLWNFFLRQAFGITSLNFCLLGRWISYMREGTFRHPKIAAAEPRAAECAVGWISHYSIGVVFSLGFVGLASGDWLARPTALPALAYGLVTVVSPFFILQPSLGLGIAAARTSHPGRARLKSVGTHLVFGFGLYLCALALRYLLQGSIQ
jgi:hypothetical protein